MRMIGATGQVAMESRRGLPSPMVAFYKMMGFCARWPKSKVFGRYYMGYLPWDEPAQIEVVSGAFCMLRRQAIEKVGLLDEDFFMYGEDIDLSYRILKGGFHNYYLPVDILHYKGESTEKSSFRYVHVFMRRCSSSSESIIRGCPFVERSHQDCHLHQSFCGVGKDAL